MLDLARYSLYSSKNILEIFKECKDLIWIPNQVYKEFNKNKYSVFGQLKKSIKILKKIY
nr:PIN-like domain-containing protein [Finegoldia magna]